MSYIATIETGTISGYYLLSTVSALTSAVGTIQVKLNTLSGLTVGPTGIGWTVTGLSGKLQDQIDAYAISVNSLIVATGDLQSQIATLNSFSGASGVLRADITSYGTNLTNLNNLSGNWATIIYTTGISGVLQSQITSNVGIITSQGSDITALKLTSGNWATPAFVTGASGRLQGEIDIYALSVADLLTATGVLEAQIAAIVGSEVTYPQFTGASGWLQSQITTNTADITALKLTSGNWTTAAFVTGISGGLQIQITSSAGTITTQGADITALKLTSGNWATPAYVTGASGVLRTDITAIQAVDTSQNINITALQATGVAVNALSGTWATTSYVGAVSGVIRTDITIVSGIAAAAAGGGLTQSQVFARCLGA